MSNRRKLKPLQGRRSAHKLPPASMSAFNQMARKTCAECGAPVRWVDAAAAKEHGMDVAEALEFLGVSSVEDVQCWVCTACDNAGVMGPASYD